MENRSSFLLSLSLGIFLLLLGHCHAEDRTEPRRNDNLSPCESWRSAYFCLNNKTMSWTCTSKAKLTFQGAIDVSDSEIQGYCEGGCHDRNLIVMQCIQDVKRDFYFENKAPLWFIKNATLDACTVRKGFNTTSSYKGPSPNPNSATSLYGRLYMPLVSTLTTLAFIVTFNV